MSNLEKVSYIRGLVEGLELDGSKKEVKVLNAVIDLLDDMAKSMARTEEALNETRDQLDEVDEDLGLLEDDFYGDEDLDDEEDEDEDDEDECYYEVTCPNCNETICLSEDIICDGQIECPNCGKLLEFDLDDDCDCGCGCEDCQDKE